MLPRQAMLRRLAARIIGWQAAVAAVLLTPAEGPARAAAAVSAAGLIVWTAVPIGGRTGDQWLAARLRFRRRMRHRRRAASPIDAVISAVETRGHADRAGNRVGLVADGPAWSAVLRLDPLRDADLVPRLQRLLDELAQVMAEVPTPATGPQTHDVRVAAVQVVGWSVPLPGQSRGGPAAMRTYWVAVRFVPTLDPDAVQSRGGGEQGAVRAAAAAASRLAARLRSRGFPLRVLDGAELTGELGTSLGLEPPRRSGDGAAVAPAAPPAVRETWRAWSLGALHHACFRPRHQPRSTRALARTLTMVARPPAVTASVSVLLTREDGQPPRPLTVVRVAVPASRKGFAVRSAIRRGTTGLRAQVVPLHGQHLAGVRATIPIACGLDPD